MQTIRLLATFAILSFSLMEAHAQTSTPEADLQACAKVESPSRCSCIQQIMIPEHFAIFGRLAAVQARTDITEQVKKYQTNAILSAATGGNMTAGMTLAQGIQTAEKACPVGGGGSQAAAPSSSPASSGAPPSQRCVEAREFLTYLNEKPSTRDPSGSRRQAQERRVANYCG